MFDICKKKIYKKKKGVSNHHRLVSFSPPEDVRNPLRRLREDGQETEQGAGPATGRASEQEALVE